VKITRKVEIGRPVEEVFDFVADARNDARWCPKVKSVSRESGSGADARYAVVHKPVPGQAERQMEMTCVGWDRPRRLDWREDDGTDVFLVSYTLEPLHAGRATRLTQTSDATVGAPRLLRPHYRVGIGRDMAGQLRRLRKLLEG
jgi:carbon monoxide dehydrogenase subunit G